MLVQNKTQRRIGVLLPKTAPQENRIELSQSKAPSL